MSLFRTRYASLEATNRLRIVCVRRNKARRSWAKIAAGADGFIGDRGARPASVEGATVGVAKGCGINANGCVDFGTSMGFNSLSPRKMRALKSLPVGGNSESKL